MKLFPPEPDIKLYEQGFDGNDVLDRATTGKKLSELVEKIQDPMVIALDGSWGSGKTHFLKCWVGAHTLENNGTARTIYFDAFEHDFMDDPLIALTGIIAERFEKAGDKRALKIWQKVKSAAPALGRAALRAGVSVATVGVVNKADELGDAAAEAIGNELKGGASDFWKREDGKRAAMTAFRTALEEMTKPKKGLSEPQKIVIVVDELDRCRPDYALAMLEVMKHFFAVPNVHFVLGVNLEELENSVRARYGSGANAAQYLQKFIHLKMPLVMKIQDNGLYGDALTYWDKIGADVVSDVWGCVRDYVKNLNLPQPITLRDLQRIRTLVVLSRAHTLNSLPRFNLLVGLIIFQVIEPSVVSNARCRKLKAEDVENYFALPQSEKDPRWRTIRLSWRYFLEPDCVLTEDEQNLLVVDNLKGSVGLDMLSRIVKNHLDIFEVYFD